MNVAIADPNPVFRRVAAASLEKEGAHVVAVAAMGAELIERVKGTSVDALFVSRHALDASSWPVALLHLSKKASPARVVLVTLFEERGYERPALAAGADAVVSRESWHERIPELLEALGA